MSSARLLFVSVLVVPTACVPQRSTSPAAEPASAVIVAGTTRIHGGALFADVITHGLVPTDREILIDEIVTGPGFAGRTQRRCWTQWDGAHECNTMRVSSSGLETLDSQGVALDAKAEPGTYTITMSASGHVIGSSTVALVRVPTVGGATQLAAVPGATVLQAAGTGLIAWVPVDARMHGKHVVQFVWFRNGKPLGVSNHEVDGLYAYMTFNGHLVDLDTPAFRMAALQLGPPQEATGDFELVALLDAKLVLAAWKFSIGDRGLSGEGATMHDKKGDGWRFLGTVTSHEPTPQLVADARAQAKKEPHDRLDPIDGETVACAMATNPKARTLFEQLAKVLDADDQSGSSYAQARSSSIDRAEVRAQLDHRRPATDAEKANATAWMGSSSFSGAPRDEQIKRNIAALGKREQAGCLARAVGPKLAPYLAK